MPSAREIAETLQTPLRGEYDVIVAGGGASGLIAAVSAARAGARTALIERAGSFGGTGTTSMVAQWIGFYHGGTRIVGGLPFELTQRVQALGGSDGFNSYVFGEASAAAMTLYNFPFNPEITKIACDEIALEAGVDVFLHSQIVRSVVNDGRVQGVVIENISGRSALAAKIVVDATGDAAVAADSGVPFVGDEPELRHRRQPCTLVFRMSNVDVKRFRGLPREEKRAIALEGLREGRLFWESLSFCSTPGGTDGICLMSRISEIDALDASDITRAEIEGRRQIKSIVEFLRERVPGFERSILAGIAARVGVRETRRIVGQYTHTLDDIKSGKQFEDSIALGAGPVDTHEAGGTSVSLWMPPLPFEIPLRCMLPQAVDGIIVTGRAVSATREANAGNRHMGTAMTLGEAAGLYAALYAKGEASLAEPNSERIRKILHQRDAMISVEDALPDVQQVQRGAVAAE